MRETRREMKTGLVCGGPADGKTLSSEASRIMVPVPAEAVRFDSHGNPSRFHMASYRWAVVVWLYEGTGPHP